MLEHRPFLEWPLAQLAEHARKHAGHPEVVARLLHEAACRPGRQARSLQRRLESLIGNTGRCGGARESQTETGAESEADGEVAAAYAVVWLRFGAPDWLVLAARRAFRRHLHPDGHTGADKTLAEDQFKRAEAAFGRILARRSEI